MNENVKRTLHATAQRALQEAPQVPQATAQPREYLVCCLPEDHINYRVYAIRVEYRGQGLWAVERHTRYADAQGNWSFRSSDDAWIQAHRFDLETALRIAKEQAALIFVGPHTVTDALNEVEP